RLRSARVCAHPPRGRLADTLRMRAALLTGLLLLCAFGAAWAGIDLHVVAPLGIVVSDTAALVVVGDVNGDGVADVAVGLEGDRRTSLVTVDDIVVVGFSGADVMQLGFFGFVLLYLNEPSPPEG